MKLLYYFGELEGYDTKLYKCDSNDDSKREYIEINFSREYDFYVDKNIFEKKRSKIIEISLSKAYVPYDFWCEKGRIYNSTLLVGKNGSGKTLVFHNLLRAIVGSSLPLDSNQFLVWKKDDNCLLFILRSNREYYYTKKNISNLFTEGSCSSINIAAIGNQHDCMAKYDKFLNNNLRIFYFSNSFSKNDLLLDVKGHFDTDIGYFQKYVSILRNESIVGKIYNLTQSQSHNVLEKYYANEYTEEVEFVFNSNVQNKLKNIREHILPFPKELKISTIKNVMAELLLLGDKRINSNTDTRTNTSVKESEPYDPACKTRLLVYQIALLSMARIMEIINDKRSPKDSQRYMLNIIARADQGIANRENSIANHRKIIGSLLDTFQGDKFAQSFRDFPKEIKNVRSFINFLYNNGDISFGNFFDYIEDSKITVIPGKDRRMTFSLETAKFYTAENQCSIRRFVELYNNTIDTKGSTPYLRFEWGLSSGEENVLSMLSSIYTNCNYDNSFQKIDTVQLFIDEADIGYHPEWQRKWFYVFPKMINELFDDNVKDIQFVIATHSPLLLGDIPSRCSYYIKMENQRIVLDNYLKLSNGKVESSFGQNLYTLLQSGFFLQNSALGEISIKKSEIIATAFRMFRNLIWGIEENKAIGFLSKTNEKKIKKTINKINKENKRVVAEIFSKDGYDYSKTTDFVKRESLCLKINEKEYALMYEAYMYYIYKLISLYSGFIRKKLLLEYQEIISYLTEYAGTSEIQIEQIDREIERLKQRKKNIIEKIGSDDKN